MVQDGEQEKQKSYLARCRLPCPLTPEHIERINVAKELLLKQTTPTRVEQRRAMLVMRSYPAITLPTHSEFPWMKGVHALCWCRRRTEQYACPGAWLDSNDSQGERK